ncbi:CDP-glycerol glycerophosphotransferase family protein [Phycicoccus sp. M110.8]|uniref:CDP-glycerol glycerophosphotransferase family protein n=1 Tax=Phycicoccus sp. M110.8 TaxID=3075433 RepID=UPI0028FDAFD7|nr:CDP-glycerol glycerophosphotransferase family protein [Phycicoccus sp. M110.8]MDU0312706.1 CDP-glycerol glycerophosphotransferase family protein [Phycicoccus sp. M110.8]
MPARGSFTFAAGNTRKVLALPLYAIGQVAALLVPRRNDRWVVGSAFGVHDGALALVREVARRSPAPSVTWLTGSPGDEHRAEDLGLLHAPRGSLRGWWLTQRAGVVVVTHGFGDVNRYAVHGAVVVQLWHGAPLKRLHLDSPAALDFPMIGRVPAVRAALRGMYRRGTRRISVLPVSSDIIAPRLASAFGLPAERVPVLGEPRTDVLFAGTPAERGQQARQRLVSAVGALPGGPVVLYAPTWRDGGHDPDVPDREEWSRLEAWLERRDGTLLVRQHPLGAGRYTPRSPRVRLVPASVEPEVNAVLWAVDALVTDYSSILFDFAVTGRPIVFFASDVEQYSLSHGLYEPYDSLTGGTTSVSWEQTLSHLDAVLDEGAQRDAALARSRAIADRYHSHRDGRSAARIVDHVLALTRVTRPSAHDRAGDAGRGPVFFESYYGRNASCNPLALDREIARRWPSVERFWSVESSDVAVPPGATAVVVGTAAWEQARESSRLVVVNDWIRDDWRPRRGQTVVQTWHGTPLKRIALGRSDLGLRDRLAVVKQSSRWTVTLAQSPSASRILRRSYAVTRRMWVEGYPRDDVIVRGEPDGLRDELGVRTPKVVLYAPTWRDGDLGAAHQLDASALADALGADWTVMVRGHARTMHERGASVGDRVLDVTRFPDASPLLALADVLVTDYSSVMFDFSAGGRPMVFHVPDLADYAGRGRGFYWDLAARAPGPLVSTTAECARRVLDAEADAPQWAGRYAAWRARFNPLDDGACSRRIVDRLDREQLI